MKKKSIFLGIVLLVILQKNFAQDTTNISGTLTLKQCVDIALKNNIDINRSELDMQDSKVYLTQAQGNRLPYISGTINHGLSQGRAIDPFTNSYINQNLSYANYNLGANLYLWNAGSINNNVRASSLNFEASKMDWQQQKDNVTIQVILAYLQVLNNQEQLNAAVQQASVTRSQVERLAVLDKDGAIAPSTYYDTKGQLASDELSIVSLKNAVETSKLDLAKLMNVNYSKDMALEKIDISSALAIYDGTSQQVYDQAIKNLAMIKAVDLRKESAAKSLKAAKGQLYPSLILNGGLGTNYSNAASVAVLKGTSDVQTDNYVNVNDEKYFLYSPQNIYDSKKISYGDQWKNNFNSSVSIGIQIPILNGLQARSKVKQAVIQEKRSDINAKTAKTQLQQAVEQAYIDMNSAYERYQTLTSQVEDLTVSFKAAEVKFNAGVLTSVDYLLIKNKADNSNINLIAAKYDYILRTKILDFYQGKLSL
ncbi:TolC family protein [Panacibacter ginsenosidivorans]|uniref:TolC family protein n=1 Tax=Panacibacter ginsenosidivorans TaxID=1813871 RepID=A0A5B8VI52_9BACT|nr:TolC family protein [Panacibacter ginsenosidivorans]QEC69958.1 TolC family protein [Panacibacter ginsenosidivorans]